MKKGQTHVRNTKGRNTDVIIDTRRKVLMNIINEMHRTDQHIRPKTLLAKLAESGYKIDRMTLYYDRKFLAETNTFVRDIAESTYSQMIEDCHNNICYIRDQAIELASKTWQKSKAKRRNTAGQEMTETELTEDEAVPRERFYRLALDCEKQIMELLKGDVMNYSVAFLSKKLQRYKQEIQKIQTETGKNVSIDGLI